MAHWGYFRRSASDKLLARKVLGWIFERAIPQLSIDVFPQKISPSNLAKCGVCVADGRCTHVQSLRFTPPSQVTHSTIAEHMVEILKIIDKTERLALRYHFENMVIKAALAIEDRCEIWGGFQLAEE